MIVTSMLQHIDEDNYTKIRDILFNILRTINISTLSRDLLRQILVLLPDNTYDGIYNQVLRQTSSLEGGRMRIKKSIRKY
jgi:hypothetical protein